MRKAAPSFVKAGEATLTVSDLEYHAEGWLLDGEIRQWSPRTLESRRALIGKLRWFLKQQEATDCGPNELRAFLAYVTRGHEREGGRWGNERMTKPVKAGTVVSYYNILRALFAFIQQEGALVESPIESLRPPVDRADQIQPFTNEQVDALLSQARSSNHPRRDEALLLFLLDTGCRASEVCALRMRDLDLSGHRAVVRGKGNKSRNVFLGRQATKALWAYLRAEPRESDQFLFTADRGTAKGEALTRSGLGQLVRRLGRAAGIEATRSSPHTCRHTMAIEFLRAGGNVFALKELLGHTTLAMVNRYVALAQADLANQHRQFSPADRLKRR
jgi:site-specific recombinase XerD